VPFAVELDLDAAAAAHVWKPRAAQLVTLRLVAFPPVAARGLRTLQRG
jgi:hypothetical protein